MSPEAQKEGIKENYQGDFDKNGFSLKVFFHSKHWGVSGQRNKCHSGI